MSKPKNVGIKYISADTAEKLYAEKAIGYEYPDGSDVMCQDSGYSWPEMANIYARFGGCFFVEMA